MTSLVVPHRDEFADTVGYVVRGPRSSVLYVPDTDAWSTWERPIAEWVSEVDVALLDGSFFSLDELPGRDVATVGHPLIVQSMELLGPLTASSPAVWFTHFNHSNPAVDAQSPEHDRNVVGGDHAATDRPETVTLYCSLRHHRAVGMSQ